MIIVNNLAPSSHDIGKIPWYKMRRQYDVNQIIVLDIIESSTN
jgi:hypothetical protein